MAGVVLGFRYIFYLLKDSSTGHIQSLILAAVLMIIGVQAIIVGFNADLISSNRKILEDIQYRIRKMEIDLEQKRNIENCK